MRSWFPCWLAGVAFLIAGAASAADPIKQISPDDLQAILAEEEGNIIVLNLWATWCAPCLIEIPDLVAIEAELKAQGVTLIGLSVDEPVYSTDHIAAMRDRRFPEFRTYARDNRDTDYLVSVVDPAWNEVVPTTYIIDRTGTVHARIQGKKSREDFEAAVLAAMD